MGVYQGYFKFTHMYVASKLFLIYIYKYIYQKPIIYFYIVCILYSWKQCLSIVLFWYILFLSGAVYSFKQKKDDIKIAAARAEGCHLNCLGPSLFSLSHLAVSHYSFSFHMVRTEDAHVLKNNNQVTQACGTWQTACFLALRFFFPFEPFLLLCRRFKSTRASWLLFFSFLYSLCLFL